MQLLLAADSSACADALYNRLSTELEAGKQVLWFMTGGSNIAVDVAVMARLPEALTSNLTVTLTDERYGDYGHADSNWQQLLDQGVDFKQARYFGVLQQDNQSLEQTTAIYASNLDTALQEADIVIGFYGMGADGHIAGILPNTPSVDATGFATSYITETYTRITTTFQTIRRCDVAYMYAGGENKLEALTNLQDVLPIDQQPAQVLKELPEACIFNDQIGDVV